LGWSSEPGADDTDNTVCFIMNQPVPEPRRTEIPAQCSPAEAAVPSDHMPTRTRNMVTLECYNGEPSKPAPRQQGRSAERRISGDPELVDLSKGRTPISFLRPAVKNFTASSNCFVGQEVFTQLTSSRNVRYHDRGLKPPEVKSTYGGIYAEL
jgi:hypothetical protein